MKLDPKLDSLISDINKKYGLTILNGNIPVKERIPFSSPYLNYVTYGGVCYGASSELVGQESSGKSTLAQDLIKNFQKIEKERYESKLAELNAKLAKAKGKEEIRIKEEIDALPERIAVYLDIEQSLDPDWLKALGVDDSKIFITQPSAMGIETPLDWIVQFSETPSVGFIIVDSIGAMMSDAEDNKLIGEFTYGGVSKALTRFYKKIMPNLKRNNIALLVINQTRDDMNNPYNQFNRPGGKMHKFAQSLSLGLVGGQKLDDRYADATGKSEVFSARETNVQVIKNKTAPPDRQRCKFTIRMGYGVDVAYDTFLMACDLGHIQVTGAYYTIVNPLTGEVNKHQGKLNAVEAIRRDQALLEAMWQGLYEHSIVLPANFKEPVDLAEEEEHDE